MADPLDVELLNESEKEALNSLKERFANHSEKYVHDEQYLMYWLKARKFNVDNAEAMLLNHLRYRKALGMDSPSYPDYQPVPVLAKYYPHGVFGHDKEGHPVAYFPLGGIDPKGVTCNCKASDNMKAIFYWQEERLRNCAAASKKFGKRIQQILFILDLKGLGGRHLWKPGMDFYQKISRSVEQHTPEIMYKVYIINAPKIFPIFYKIVMPIMDENTRTKVHIFDDNFQDAMLDIIDKSELPVYYGGEAVDEDGDPNCGKHIFYGGTVPKEMYHDKSTEEFTDKDLTELYIHRSSQTLFPIDIDQPDSVLRWFFKCDCSFDIGFSIYRKWKDCQGDVKDMEMVVPYFRLITCYVPESGQIHIENAGQYVVQFDNTYSWLYGKTIKYRITVENKEGQEILKL